MITPDESLIASLKIVGSFLAEDGRVLPKERLWFAWLLKRHVSDPEVRALLMAGLEQPVDLEETFASVVFARDRERLLGWARIACAVDDHVDPREQNLYQRLKTLNDMGLKDHYREMAKHVLEHERRIQMWREIDEMGRYYSQPAGFGLRMFPHSVFLRAALSDNRYIAWVSIGLVVIFLVVRWLVRS